MNPAENQVPAEWNIGDVILDLYEVKDIHEGGGMGLVYRVHHRGWNMDLAVKSPRQEFFQTERQKENFTRECETWISLGLHPHVVSCHYVRNLGGIPRVFAEYVEGGSLHDWIASRKLYEGGPQEALKRILDIAIQMAWGLQNAHEQGLIHQDVKPANVMMTPDGAAKVTDFGLAKARAATGETTASAGHRSILVSTGGMTPPYASPEQANKQTLSRKTDIWSWAVAVLEMFVGEVCWQSGTAAREVLENLNEVRAEKTDLPEMPDVFRRLLRDCFELDPDDRPKSFEEVTRRLLQVHHAVLGEDYARQKPKAVELRADGLNNHAVSLLDLGREQDALEVFDQALNVEPNHIEAIYNRGLFQWRKAQFTDQSLLAALRGANTATEKEWRGKLALSLVHLERGDNESALRELEGADALVLDNPEVRQALHRAAHPTGGGHCVRAFEGHTDGVKSVAISPDGLWALSGSLDATLRLWDLETGRCVRIFENSEHLAETLAISPDSRWCLSGDLQGRELATGRCMQKLRWSAGSLAISKDGRWCLAAAPLLSDDCALRLFELATGRFVRAFEGHRKTAFSVAISPDGRWGLSGSWDETLRLWELETGQCVWVSNAHKGGVRTVAISPCGQTCLSGGDDEAVRLWRLETGQCIRTFIGHTERVTSVAISADGRWGLSGSGDQSLRLWALETGRCIRTFDGHTKGITSVAISPDGRRGLSGSFDSKLRLWRLPITCSRSPYRMCLPLGAVQRGTEEAKYKRCLNAASTAMSQGRWDNAALAIRNARTCAGFFSAKEAMHTLTAIGRFGIKSGLAGGWCSHVFEGKCHSVSSIAISPDGRWCLTCGGDNTVQLWDLKINKCIRTFDGHNDWVESVAISKDVRWGLSSSCDHTLRLWELQTGKCVRTFYGHISRVCSTAISADSRWILSGSFDGTMRLWELNTGECVRTFEGNTFWVETVGISPDGRCGLSGSRRTLRLWALQTGECIRTFDGHMGDIISLAISPDGLWALSGSRDSTLRLWELATGRCLRTLEGHTEDVFSVAITPDGRWGLSGSADHTLRLWELQTGKCVQSFEGNTDSVWCVTITPDWRWVLSGSRNNPVRLWELDWEYEFPEAADWDGGARPYLEIFLTLHCSVGKDGFSRIGKPSWREKDFRQLVTELEYRGYGWLRPEGVRRKLEEMAAEWKGAPPLPGC